MTSPHESMRLSITNEHFYIQALDSQSDILVIDRVTQDNSLQAEPGLIPAAAITKNIYGIFGIIRLVAGPYLVVITNRARVGEINGQAVWKVTATEVLSYKRTILHLNDTQAQDNKHYLSLVDIVLSMDSFYYSHTYDITHSVQRLQNTSPEFSHMPLHERADPRFVWNNHMLRELTQQPELARFCLPMMLGFVEMRKSSINSRPFNYIVISRRSCFRAGTRYYIRGLDSEGHAANFVETEQIVEIEGYHSSFVQTRGSVPMYWNQRPNLKYKPDPVISQSHDHLQGFQVHFATQIYNYGKQVLVNLLDQKGFELRLVSGYASAVETSNNDKIQLEAFDFHHECKKMQWHRLSLLTDQTDDAQTQLGYFLSNNGTVIDQQGGVFRTNCIDCLDRTNVVQSLFARKHLQALFTRLSVMQQGERIENQTSFEEMFRNVWADNADACAKQYAGTGALKTDFTRTGKRQFWGPLKDGVNCAIRYIINNFYDGTRQDAIDLFLGNYVVDESEGLSKASPFQTDTDLKFFALPTTFIVALSMTMISILLPDEHLSEQLFYILFWGGASALSLAAIYFYGNDFVNKPRLTQANPKTD